MSHESWFSKSNITLYCIEVSSHNSLLVHLFWQASTITYEQRKKDRHSFPIYQKLDTYFFAPFLCNATIKVFLVMTNMIHCLNPISVTRRRRGSLMKKAWNFITVRQLGTLKHMLQYLLLQVMVLYLHCVKNFTLPNTIWFNVVIIQSWIKRTITFCHFSIENNVDMIIYNNQRIWCYLITITQ